MKPVAPMTVATLLGSGDPNRAGPAVEHGLRRVDAAGAVLASAGHLGKEAFRLVDQRVAEALGGPLAIDVGVLVLDGWRKYRELVAASERTRDAPGQPEDVVLGDHEITSTHHPEVDVIVDGSLVSTLTFELTVSLELRGVIAIVEKGRLTTLRCGDVVAGARISLWDQELARGEVSCVVGMLVQLGDGVMLVPAAPAPGPGPGPRAAASAPWWDRVPRQQPPQPFQWPKPT